MSILNKINVFPVEPRSSIAHSVSVIIYAFPAQLDTLFQVTIHCVLPVESLIAELVQMEFAVNVPKVAI